MGIAVIAVQLQLYKRIDISKGRLIRLLILKLNNAKVYIIHSLCILRDV